MIKKMIPLSVKRFLRNRVKIIFGLKDIKELQQVALLEMSKRRKEMEESIPIINLEERNIKNLKILLGRREFLMSMPMNAVCAEIGVDRGQFSEQILKITNPEKLHLIDPWGDSSRYNDGLKLEVQDKFASEIEAKKVEVNIGFSTEVLRKFPDNYFDWVYIDTDHTYKTTSEELRILKSKMKDNGIIGGHDYIVGNWASSFRYGVIEAVHEFCVRENWELIYLTTETNQCRNFAIRKIL
jgi:hypothetical protein